MEAKALLIPLAAFALSATGVSAFNSDVLQKAGLTEDQISAFEQAHELRQDGDKNAARDVLQEAGIDLETMESVRKAMYEYKQAMRSAVDEAVENNDYGAFREAIDDSPLSDIITTEEDFQLFREAHELRDAGEHKEAREIMEDLGVKHGPFGSKIHVMKHTGGHTDPRFNGFRGGQ